MTFIFIISTTTNNEIFVIQFSLIISYIANITLLSQCMIVYYYTTLDKVTFKVIALLIIICQLILTIYIYGLCLYGYCILIA